jgi:hypothetical protein
MSRNEFYILLVRLALLGVKHLSFMSSLMKDARQDHDHASGVKTQ